ncbi:hypothetical protein [Pseudobdellovibrio sp. HCB154]|uniref:hypothetical protein n=1 Tax=Pseudobdellovibrio sp. HCB154 TaxID=3386277 RepID=UPI00391724CA
MKKYLFILISIALIASCKTAEKQNVEPIHIDPKLLIPWGEALKDETTAESPAIYEFKSKDKKLWYLASRHSNKIDQPVFKYISEVINKKPDVIIVEGFESDLGFSPKEISESVLQGIKDGFYPAGEPSYAIELATKNNIPYIGGEPNDKLILQEILKAGYTANDLLSFNFVRRMPQINRSGELKKNKVENIYAKYIKSKARDFDYKGKTLNFNKFKEWYLKNQGKKFSLTAGEKGETAPIEGPYFTQKISLEVTKIRDINILQLISNMMNKYNKVVIIYGSSHYRVEHKAIKASLGEPKRISL